MADHADIDHTGLTGVGAADHGALTGLSDDDHPQYATNTEFDDHSARHESGGADAVKLDDLAAPDDNTDLNASTSAHGLLRKLDNNSAHFLDGQGNWGTPSGAGLGAWTTYTPTVANLTLGNGTLIGRYKALDANTYAWWMSLTWGSTTSCSGDITVALPATARTGGNQTCAGYVLDAGTVYYLASGRIASAASVVGSVFCADAIDDRIIDATHPMTWATNDELTLFGTLEV